MLLRGFVGGLSLEILESYRKNGVPPLEPFFLKIDTVSCRFLRHVFQRLRAEQPRITLHSLKGIKKEEQEIREGRVLDQKDFAEIEKAKFRLTLLHQTLQPNLSSNWSWDNFRKYLEQYFNYQNRREIEAFELRTERILKEDAERNSRRIKSKTESSGNPDVEVSNKHDYSDLTSAILYFKKREREITALDLDSQDKEMLLIRLAEKRSKVLDEFI